MNKLMQPMSVAEVASVAVYSDTERFASLGIDAADFATHLPVVVPGEFAAHSNVSLLQATSNHMRAFFVAKPDTTDGQQQVYSDNSGNFLNLKGNEFELGSRSDPRFTGRTYDVQPLGLDTNVNFNARLAGGKALAAIGLKSEVTIGAFAPERLLHGDRWVSQEQYRRLFFAAVVSQQDVTDLKRYAYYLDQLSEVEHPFIVAARLLPGLYRVQDIGCPDNTRTETSKIQKELSAAGIIPTELRGKRNYFIEQIPHNIGRATGVLQANQYGLIYPHLGNWLPDGAIVDLDDFREGCDRIDLDIEKRYIQRRIASNFISEKYSEIAGLNFIKGYDDGILAAKDQLKKVEAI